MKKIVSLLLCILLLCLSLASCSEDPIGEDLKNRDNASGRGDELVELNFYIVVGEGTSEDAIKTVPQNINSYLKEMYNIKLNINYCNENDYASTVLAAAANTENNGANQADIVLINSKSLFDTLYAQDSLVSLTDYYNSRKYRSLNSIVEDKLLAASLVKELVPGQENVKEEDRKYTSNYYTVPNNHLIGEYKYIVIDKAMARDTLHFSNAKLEAMNTEASLTELKSAISAYFGKCEYIMSDYVNIVTGNYADKLLLEHGVDSVDDITEDHPKINYVNVASYPSATEEEAFSSAYAIIKNFDDVGVHTEEKQAELDKHYEKCMDIIFALNTDEQLKNILQYGYVGTNYKFIKNNRNENTDYIERLKGDLVVYNMNPIYTGNLYISHYCEEIGWNAQIHADILKQNADALTSSEKVQAEIDALEFENFEVDTDCEISLPVASAVEGDVSFVWTSSSDSILVVDNEKLVITIPTGADAVTETVTITVVATYGSASASMTFKIKLVKSAE